MERQQVTAVFDIGRTNKKFFLFDAEFREVYREYVRFAETRDEDGYPTEDLRAVRTWMREVFHRVLEDGTFDVRAINFSSYGASFVHLDAAGEVVTPLYNYTKPIDTALVADFYATYGPEAAFALATGSANSGMLNSGMQLYWLKHRQPDSYARIKYSLHLPQYLSYVFTGIPFSEYTSIGCHTALWDYGKAEYHGWVYAEGLHRILPPIVSAETSINLRYRGRRIKVGVGIHDSSAALLPYLESEQHAFILVSTGTWSISLNPSGAATLYPGDLAQNCINYMRIDGRPVKAARLFLGEEYRRQLAHLTLHYGVAEERHHGVRFDYLTYQHLARDFTPWFHFEVLDRPDNPPATHLPAVAFDCAYHHLLMELVELQVASIRTVIGRAEVTKLFVDGGFSDNEVFVQLLAHHFREMELWTTKSSMGSALGAAMCVSDRELDPRFLQKQFGLKRHRPFKL